MGSFFIPSNYVEVALEWARTSGLESDPLMYRHDYVHAAAGLGIRCEGIVMAIEECLHNSELPTIRTFEGMCADGRIDSDRFAEAEILRGYRWLRSAWIERPRWAQSTNAY